MNCTTVNDSELMEKSKNVKNFAIAAIALKCAVVFLGFVFKVSLVFLACGLYIPVIQVLCVALIVILLPFIAFLWLVYFAYIIFAVIALVQSVKLVEEGKKTPDGSLPKEANDEVMFALISSIIILVLLFVK